MSSSAETQFVPSVILTCFALQIGHADTCPITSSLFACSSLVVTFGEKKALGGNSNLASRAVHSLTSELGSADYLWPRHPWICIICCPRLPSALSIFNIGSALCLSLSVRFLHLSFTTTSSLPVFHLISGSLLQGAEASLLSAPADVSSIIILKAF